MNKRVIIISYFGTFPSYFDLFLRSCEYNKEFDFLIFSDKKIEYAFPNNITNIVMTFNEFKEMMEAKLEIKIKKLVPYKLCDYKAAYGRVLQDYIKSYEFWGYCDCDLIFGDISKFITEEVFEKYEKILINGHLCFYKNDPIVNNYYQLESDHYITFKEAVEVLEPCFIDEISMPGILKEHHVPQYENYMFADMLPQYKNFVLSPICEKKNEDNQIFYWKEGKVFREYTKGTSKVTEEMMYIHLQKRKMDMIDTNIKKSNIIYISSKGFTKGPHIEENKNKKRMSYYRKQIQKTNLNRIKIKIIIKTKRKIFKLKGVNSI